MRSYIHYTLTIIGFVITLVCAFRLEEQASATKQYSSELESYVSKLMKSDTELPPAELAGSIPMVPFEMSSVYTPVQLRWGILVGTVILASGLMFPTKAEPKI